MRDDFITHRAIQPLMLGLGLGSGGGAVSVTPLREYIIVQAGQSNNQGYTQTSGTSSTLDVQDARIRVMHKGKGANLLTGTTFRENTTGWSSPNGTISGGSVGTGYLRFTPTNASFPYITRTITGLTIGQTYEIEAEFSTLAQEVQLILNSATAVITNAKYCDPAKGGPVWRSRWVATGTSHDVRVLSNSGTTPLTALFDLKRIEVRNVLTTGTSYPQATEITSDWEDAANYAALGTNPPMHMARRLLERQFASRVIIIPVAIGGTGLVGDVWDPDTPGSRYSDTVTKLTAAIVDHPNAVPIFTWLQGEWDATVGLSEVRAYIEKFRTLMAGLRAIAGAAQMPAIVGGMVPEYILATAGVARINDAHLMLPNEIPNLTFVASPTGYQKAGEAFHFTAAGARAIGRLWADAVNVKWF